MEENNQDNEINQEKEINQEEIILEKSVINNIVEDKKVIDKNDNIDILTEENKTILIIILNISLSTLLCLTISRSNPCLLLILLSIILGNIMFNEIDDESERYKIIFIGLCIYLSMFFIELKRNEFIFDKLQNTMWKFVYITILIRYLIKIEI